ncbi:MAG: hypothetical protein RL693_1772 [Verrucomicrobiota bacterium]|jgi:arsenate reductase
MRKKKVLFVCIHNSARSQMAEAWLNHLCPEFAVAESAGLEPGKLNVLAVEVMKEAGIDISGNLTKGTLELFTHGNKYDFVITVCDEKAAERCPTYPGFTQRLHWIFADPSKFEGSWDERIAQARSVRDDIKAHIQQWCESECKASLSV